MAEILCSTGALIGKANNRDYIEAVWGIGFKMAEE